MADEAPISDVLCEAMEYLCKLGTNLRLRSESLKEKRIRKDKLKNSHAVQKAADKLLLICELSKKSLENVESGVRNVLSLLNERFKSSSHLAHSSTSRTSDEADKFQYFKHQSHKLKISKKVPVKHYMSAKVLARRMLRSIQDSYPVYYDCKLYRQRRREEKLYSSKDFDVNTNVPNKSKIIEINDDTKDYSNYKNSSLLVPLEMDAKNEEKSFKNFDINISTGVDENTTITNALSESSGQMSYCSVNETIEKNQTCASNVQKSQGNIDIISNKKTEKLKKKRFRNIRFMDDSSDNSDVRDVNEVNKKEIDNVVGEQAISSNTAKKNLDHEIEEKRYESEYENSSTNEIDKTSPTEKLQDKVKGTPNPSPTPMIKCVNINKLLKPNSITKEDNIIQKVNSSEKNAKKIVEKEHISENFSSKSDASYWAQKRKEVSAFKPKKITIEINRLPKFSVNFLQIHSLKKITQGDMVVYELENTQQEDESFISRLNNMNKVKNTLLEDSDSEKSNKSKSPPPTNFEDELKSDVTTTNKSTKETNHNTVEEVEKENKDKNLDISETNQDEGEIENDLDKLKQSLLYESDSDSEMCKGNNTKEILKETGSGNIEDLDCQPLTNSNEFESNILLDKILSPCKDTEEGGNKKSSDDGLKTPPNRKRKCIDSETPRSKRKNIMESMHAKKMLLTYSSSSDTEDEQLRNALKEIKDSLLKGISSDDENAEKEFQSEKDSKKNFSTSESDEDILNKIKEKTEVEDTAKKIKHHNSSKKIGRSRARGSSQNSDSQDSNEKNIDGLTNLKNLMKNHRRLTSTSSDAKTDSNSIKETKKMPKAPLISEENMLNADSSSEVASGGESDGPEEDLPPISLSGLNGSGGDHLAKDDLLDESDTSTSHNEKDEADKNDSDEGNNLKSKRRKANAISSDSEVGSSRKKDQNARLSDFEDSEDESSDPVKKTKRKKIDNESDASVGSSSDDGSKKKRRRIKLLNESDVSGSDTENEGRNKHGRKNIRKVMGKNQLEEATKKAAREEKERIARITERQKLYNNLEFDESGKPDEVVLEKVVLDFEPETKEPLIQVDRGLVKKLKPHQANGIKFMWDACFESVKRIKKDRGSGCILAHCMGLGKTLQVVSLTHTLLTHGDLTTVNRVLVVCPLSTVLNWVNEFNMWLKHSVADYDVDVYELSRYKQNSERAFQLQQWFEGGGVCVLGYEMFRNLSADNPKKFKKKMLRHFQEALVDPGPDLVVCDEGHLLKNEKTSLSQSMNRVKTRRRIVLTGTPLQNNLKEYYCMVQFVKPNLLGKYNEYLNRFVNPITNGQYTDSTEHDIRIMKRRSHVLHKMLDGAVQRRDYGVLAPFLPPKHEYVLFITLTEVQIKLYQYYLDNYSRRPLPGKSSGFLFPDFQSLQRIWTHPLVLKYNSERYEIMQQKKREREEEEDSEGSLADFIDDDSTPDESSTEESSDDLSDASEDSRKKNKKKKSLKKGKGKDSKMNTRRGTRANPVEMEDDEVNEVVEMKAENPTEWWIKLVTEDELEDVRHSHKLILLFDILRQCEAIGDKLLVFSQSLYSLDLIEHFLGKVDEATQDGRIDDKLGGHVGSWSPGVDYFRLDGSTSCENRSIWCKNFNREDNPRARLFLISTRAGGLGINLVAANRVVIFDVSWNPSHDVQSIFRVYRFGQKKPCYVYRFLAMGTMEEKIYERQVTKQAISKRVIDEQQIDRHYAENDLAELYKFEPRPPTPRPLPPLPKDRLFAEMLKEHEAQIYKYHEHDSLLENKEEETLSEEERKAAWEDFENEKNRPPPAPFPSAWPMHNGMVPSLLAQQQQQLAYAALAAMLRKDMPNINDNQIRDMLPLIYNANPAMFGGYDYGLMQKMTEIYKYAPGAMMNPAMMNQVMNPAGVGAGGGVGGLGGTSGLQYSPPWQRQQQMRLQQLMQHQNQMGAKYYAGGLGSRDPVAMALQQQRAREIMAGEQARGRPRGRPPLARASPAAPTAPLAPADVVNLDSD